MQLTPNWRKIVRRAHSMHGLYAMILFSIAQSVLPYFEIELDATTYRNIMLVLAAVTTLLRILRQTDVSDA